MADRRRTLVKSRIWSTAVRAFAYGLTLLGALFTLLPFVWMVLTSFKGPADIASIPLRWLPRVWRWKNYTQVWRVMPFGRFYLNSVIIACTQTLGVLLTASLGAYGYSRVKFFGRDAIFVAYLSVIMIPGWVTIIPAFLLIKQLGWLNTYQGLIIPGLTSVFGTFLLRQFFMSIPEELEDAALIDGANRLQTYARIVLPLARPALLTVGLMNFMGSWNNLLWPLLIAQDEKMLTLPLGIARLAINQGGWASIKWGPLMAATFMSILPLLALYVALQNFFIRGIALTGLK